MDILILSPGRRVDIVNYFKDVFHKHGDKVYTLDMSPYAAALYEGDKYFVIEKDFNNLEPYIYHIINICKDNNIGAVISLIDPELVLLAKYSKLFTDNNIIPIVSEPDIINQTFDKYKFYETYKNRLPLLKTYLGADAVFKALENKDVTLPVFAKKYNGSGSDGIGRVNSENELMSYKNKDDFIFQPDVLKTEYGCDIYFDMISGKIISYFIKKKLNMRAGETDKSVSVKNKTIENIIFSLENLGFRGPVDMDVFEDKDGNYYINEFNPRFGGGYPHAYNGGVNFMSLIYENLSGKENSPDLGNYKENLYMMKYNGTLFVPGDDIAKVE